MKSWPYPLWIAHRGAGRLAPENTLPAFDTGLAHGFRMFECDVKLSSDGVAFLLHDDTLDRTTSGRGPAGALDWAALSALDAGAWHSPAFAGTGLPTLSALARWCIANDALVNLEIKPCPGTAAATGEAVAREARALWADAEVPPLLTSFDAEALEAARTAAPGLPRGLLLEALAPGWLHAARDLGCVAVVAHHPLWTPAMAADVHAAGLRCLAYTVNDAAEAARLLKMRLDGLITDRVDLFDTDWVQRRAAPAE